MAPGCCTVALLESSSGFGVHFLEAGAAIPLVLDP
jgi:hypothetical protein